MVSTLCAPGRCARSVHRGIWLHGNGGSDIELDVLDLSSGDSVPVECRVLLIHPSSPERSYLKCEGRLIAGVKPTIHLRDRKRRGSKME